MHKNLKGELLLKTKNLHIHLYFIATKYLQNNALVEYIDSWTKFHSFHLFCFVQTNSFTRTIHWI